MALREGRESVNESTCRHTQESQMKLHSRGWKNRLITYRYASPADKRRVQTSFWSSLADVLQVQFVAIPVASETQSRSEYLGKVDQTALSRVEMVDLAKDQRDRDERQVEYSL